VYWSKQVVMFRKKTLSPSSDRERKDTKLPLWLTTPKLKSHCSLPSSVLVLPAHP